MTRGQNESIVALSEAILTAVLRLDIGLGQLAVQYAKVMGLHVAALDVTEDKLALARASGADLTVNAKSPDAAAANYQSDWRGCARRSGNCGITNGVCTST
jgi:Zn-dependent alcohol dehydrogenase